MAKSTREIGIPTVTGSEGALLEERVGAGQCCAKGEPSINRVIKLNIRMHRKFVAESDVLLKTSFDKMAPMEREKSQLICVVIKNIGRFNK